MTGAARWIMKKNINTSGKLTYTNHPAGHLLDSMTPFDKVKKKFMWISRAETITGTSAHRRKDDPTRSLEVRRHSRTLSYPNRYIIVD